MKKALIRVHDSLHYYFKSDRVEGPHENLLFVEEGLKGNCTNIYGKSYDLVGDCSNISGCISNLEGDCTYLSGDCTGVYGNCTGIQGDIDHCKLTKKERETLVDVQSLIGLS